MKKKDILISPVNESIGLLILPYYKVQMDKHHPSDEFLIIFYLSLPNISNYLKITKYQENPQRRKIKIKTSIEKSNLEENETLYNKEKFKKKK
jgi:hypothetical protein